ncbi:MAG: pyrroline-5-carboxylate reductase [Geminicoccaceae bacterium]
MVSVGGPLLLVGGGKMGYDILDGWLGNGLTPEAITVVEPDDAARAALQTRTGVAAITDPDADGERPRAIVFAIKPQTMAGALAAYVPLVGPGTLVVSIAAGTAIGRFEAVFGSSTAVVRAMPNTPAAIGRGATVLAANAVASESERALAEALMAAVGTVHWVSDENQMHAVTALSGGGPAYVFLLIETLARAGIEAGLPEPLALALARETVTGAGALAEASTEPADVLRRNVTSPGGTTAAALGILMDENGLQPLFDRAIAAAAERSRALA